MFSGTKIVLCCLYNFIETLIFCWKSESVPKPLSIKDVYRNIEKEQIETRIPKFIYQTHESEYLSWNIYCPSVQIIYMNPDYSYRFFDAAERRSFLVESFGNNSNAVKAYDKFKNGAYKSDIFRLCILYLKGGIYMDCKSTTIFPLKHFIPETSDFAMFIDTYDTRLSNSFIASSPKNYVIEQIMNEGIERVLQEKYGINPLDIAGPEMFGTVIRKILNIENLKTGRYKYKDLNVDLIGRTNLFDSYMHTEAGPVIKRQPDFYMFNWNRFKARYEISWLTGKVFL